MVLSQVRAVCRYEFRMQVRKRALWVSTLLLALVMILTQGDRGPRYAGAEATAREVMGQWATLFSLLIPLAFGVVLADRVVRDRRLGVRALLTSLPVTDGRLLAGKYVGGVAASGLPVLLVLLGAAGYEAVDRGTVATLGWALVAFAVVILPGLVFVAGFAVVCPLLVTAPVFRVLFVGYWFWGNLVPPSLLPSLTGTLLTPVGDYAASWLTGERALHAGASGWLEFLRPEPSGVTALLSVSLLCVVGLAPLLITGFLLRRREGRA